MIRIAIQNDNLKPYNNSILGTYIRCEMSQAAAVQLNNNIKTQQRLMVEEDCRQQIAFTAPHTQNYLEPVLAMSRPVTYTHLTLPTKRIV